MFLLKNRILLLTLGFTTILSQLIIIREFLNVFEGNELIIGLFLALWMVFTALGSSSAVMRGVMRHAGKPGILLLWISCLPFLEIILLYVFDSRLFPPGMEKGAGIMLLYSLVILFPACFLAGLLFTVLAAKQSEISRKNYISSSYGCESAGSIAAGIVFSTGFAYLFSSFQLLAFVASLNLAIVLWYNSGIRPLSVNVFVASFVIVFVLIMLNTEERIMLLHLKSEKTVYRQNTPYGNMNVTESENQYITYLNSRPLLNSNDYYIEEPVHYVLLQHKNPKKVMIISGGMQTVNEALKYPGIEKVDYVEINKWLLKAEQFVSQPVQDKRISVIQKDARQCVKESTGLYDAIVINVPDPSSAQLNRFFTLQFFHEVRNALQENGVAGISLSSTGNYLGAESLILHGIIAETIKQVFEHVTIIPGQRNYFIASDSPVTTRITKRVDTAGIHNTYVNSFYLDDDLIQQRSVEISGLINENEYPVNSDLNPVAYFVQIGQWIRLTEGKGLLPVVVVLLCAALLVSVILLIKGDPTRYAVFSSAFSGASAEFLLIFLFQVLFGNLYQMIGLVIACYMAGLFGGTIISVGNDRIKIINLVIQSILTILLLILLFFAYWISETGFTHSVTVQLILLCLTAAIAFSAGMIFNISTKSSNTEIVQTSGVLYSIDLSGAAAGALITSLVLLPLLGLLPACLIIAGMVALSAARSSGIGKKISAL